MGRALNYVKVALLLACLIVTLLPTSAQASKDGKAASVNGVRCRVYAQNPHATYSSSGNRIVNAKLRFGECNGSVSSIEYWGQLQKCYHASWGCSWSTVKSSHGVYYGSPGGLVTRNVSKSCVNGHYRLKGKIRIYKGGSSDASSWDYSQKVSVSC